MKAFEKFENTDEWKFWGVPSDISWWKAQSKDTVDELCTHDTAQDDFGRNNCAATIIAAIEEVRVWIEQGVLVDGKDWIDVGGSFGYYSIALKLLGAKTVTLVEENAPGIYSKPILDEVGVNVIIGDATRVSIPAADSLLCLYVPDVDLGGFISSRTQQVLTDQKDFANELGWDYALSKVCATGTYFAVSESSCCPDYDNQPWARDRSLESSLLLYKSQI